MFDVLADYKNNDHFFFSGDSEMKEVCNAPRSGMGVYLVYQLKNGKISLVYVGAAGKLEQNGRKNAEEGLFEELVNGDSGGKSADIWKQKVKKEKIDALDIYWYETFNLKNKDIPSYVQALVIQAHFDLNGELPAWNEKF